MPRVQFTNRVAIVASAAVLFLLSCKKEHSNNANVPPLLENVNTKQNARSFARTAGGPVSVLNFTSYEQYDGFISKGLTPPTPPAGFVSLRSIIEELDYQRDEDPDAYLDNPHLPDTIYENYGRLLDVLNEDKIVNLNGYLVKVDLYNEAVYSIKFNSLDSYDMLFFNTNSPDVMTEPTDEEVALRVFGLARCRDGSASEKHKSGDDYCESRYRTKKDINYQKAGIYFSLVAEAKSQNRLFRVWWSWGNNPSIGKTAFSWTQRCGNKMSWSGTAWLFDNISYDYNSHKANFRPYQNTKAFKTFDFGAMLHGCGDNYLHIAG